MKRLTAILLAATTMLVSCGDDNAARDATFTLTGSAVRTATAWYSPVLDALVPTARAAAGDPTSLKLNVYSVWLSANADCTGAVLVADNGATPVESDLFTNPDLITGSPAAGTYNCMLIQVNDTLQFAADAAAVAANEGCDDTTTEYTFDTYRDAEDDDGLWNDQDGSAIDATGSVTTPGTDTVVLFITTDTGAVQAGALGAHPNQVVALMNPVVVPTTVTLYWDFTDKVDSNSGQCWLEGAEVGVR